MVSYPAVSKTPLALVTAANIAYIIGKSYQGDSLTVGKYFIFVLPNLVLVKMPSKSLFAYDDDTRICEQF